MNGLQADVAAARRSGLGADQKAAADPINGPDAHTYLDVIAKPRYAICITPCGLCMWVQNRNSTAELDRLQIGEVADPYPTCCRPEGPKRYEAGRRLASYTGQKLHLLAGLPMPGWWHIRPVWSSWEPSTLRVCR